LPFSISMSFDKISKSIFPNLFYIVYYKITIFSAFMDECFVLFVK
jgi:hypothetical protein